MSLADIALPVCYVQIVGARIANNTFILYMFTAILPPELKTGRHLYINCRLCYRRHSAETLRHKERGEVELKLHVSLKPVLDDGVWSLSCSAALLRKK